MENAMWRLDKDNLAAYTESEDVWRRIKRSYPDFIVMATYGREGKVTGMQYRLPAARKRPIRRLLGVNVSE